MEIYVHMEIKAIIKILSFILFFKHAAVIFEHATASFGLSDGGNFSLKSRLKIIILTTANSEGKLF